MKVKSCRIAFKRVPTDVSGLDYLYNLPSRINWKIVAGGDLHQIQMYDLVFDEYDYKIRKMEMPEDEPRS